MVVSTHFKNIRQVKLHNFLKDRDEHEKSLKPAPRGLHPGKLTWNLKMNPWKRRFLLEPIIFRFHVSFRGVWNLQICHLERKMTWTIHLHDYGTQPLIFRGVTKPSGGYMWLTLLRFFSLKFPGKPTTSFGPPRCKETTGGEFGARPRATEDQGCCFGKTLRDHPHLCKVKHHMGMWPIHMEVAGR